MLTSFLNRVLKLFILSEFTLKLAKIKYVDFGTAQSQRELGSSGLSSYRSPLLTVGRDFHWHFQLELSKFGLRFRSENLLSFDLPSCY